MLKWITSLFARLARWLRRSKGAEAEETPRKRPASSFTMHGLEDRQHL